MAAGVIEVLVWLQATALPLTATPYIGELRHARFYIDAEVVTCRDDIT